LPAMLPRMPTSHRGELRRSMRCVPDS
jgi:hypothetical protein